MTRRRLWLIRLLALLLIPLFCLLIVEFALGIVGYGYPTRAIVPYTHQESSYYGDNPQWGRRFFPRHQAPELVPFRIKMPKADRTYRIFVLGGSAAQGVPDPGFGLGRLLRTMLIDAYPGIHFEVINTALPSINSHAVRTIAKDCARFQPDLFLVYLGHNEVVGPYGPQTAFPTCSSRGGPIRIRMALRTTRIGQLWNQMSGSDRDTLGTESGMESMQEPVAADDPGLVRVYQHYRANLESICHTAIKAGTPVLLCTLGTNLRDNPPFGSRHKSDSTQEQISQWGRLYQQGQDYETERLYTQARDCYLKAVELDEKHAELWFRLGQCHWLLAEYDLAKTAYVQAREWDILRFRADRQINETIRRVGQSYAQQSCYLVDGEVVLAQHSPQGIMGHELFHDQVHLTFKGNYLLARAILEQMRQVLPDWVIQANTESSVLTESQCARYLAYTDTERHMIQHTMLNDYLVKPPFTYQAYHANRVQRLQDNLTHLREGINRDTLPGIYNDYRLALAHDTEDWWLHWKYAEFLLQFKGDDQAAVSHYQVVRDALPHYPYVYAKMGLTLARLGEYQKSLELSQVALAMKPDLPDAYYSVGLVYQRNNETKTSLSNYRRVLELNPQHHDARNNLIRALCRLERFAEAEKACREGIAYQPEHSALHRNLAICLLGQQRQDEAVQVLQKVLTLDPNALDQYEMLKQLLTQ